MILFSHPDYSHYCTEAVNLAMSPGVRVEVSVPNPTGRGAHDPNVLLNETAYRLGDRSAHEFWQYRKQTYDTYDGQNESNGPDWYAVIFPEPVNFNCVDMTMESAHRDGGWWTSLDVEIRRDDGTWLPVEKLRIFPPYKFDNVAYGRQPYQTHALTFNEVTARAVRVIGKPGGIAQFTSLARLAVYCRDLSHWNPASLPPAPTPSMFRLISPGVIWDMSESLVKLTGLQIGATLMEYYLDRQRYERWWQRISRTYQGEPELWFLLGVYIGWDEWNHLANNEPQDLTVLPRVPYVRMGFYNRLGRAVAPVVIENQLIGELASGPVLIKDDFDLDWHRRYAHEHSIPWHEYKAAIKRSPQMTLEQLEGAVMLMGMLVNNIVNLAYRNLNLQHELDGVHRSLDKRAQGRQQIVQQAIDFMQANLEDPITVRDVANAVALTPTYFGILFMEITGQTPRDYLIDLRLERAKEYLAHSDMSVMDVCVALGYNPSYFCRLFKRRTGFTPGNYARQARSVPQVGAPLA